MLFNIIDKRINIYNVNIVAVFEPSFHDNKIDGASIADEYDMFAIYDMSNITIADAIKIADEKWSGPVTLFLYDADSDPLGVKKVNGRQ